MLDMHLDKVGNVQLLHKVLTADVKAAQHSSAHSLACCVLAARSRVGLFLPLTFMACRLSSAAYAAIACLAVEYVGLFLGVSLFLRAHNCLYILLHFAGAVVTGLIYTQVRTPSSCVQPATFLVQFGSGQNIRL